MTATNHIVTGAFIASVMPNPVLGLSLAFIVHFVLDSLPHFGYKNHTDRKFLYTLAVDKSFALSLLITIFLYASC